MEPYEMRCSISHTSAFPSSIIDQRFYSQRSKGWMRDSGSVADEILLLIPFQDPR
jgi:hypothetical protein